MSSSEHQRAWLGRFRVRVPGGRWLQGVITAAVVLILAAIWLFFGTSAALQSIFIVIGACAVRVLYGSLHGLPRGSVVPTTSTIVYALVIPAMIVTAIKFGVPSAAYCACVVAGICVASHGLAVRNVIRLNVDVPNKNPIYFVGSATDVLVYLRNDGPTVYSLTARLKGADPGDCVMLNEVCANGNVALSLPGKQMDRGCHQPPALVIETVFPFGLFRVRRTMPIEATIYVAPAPDTSTRPTLAPIGDEDNCQLAGALEGEMDGIRPYAVGDRINRLAWRQMARMDGQILTKVFTREADDGLVLSLAQVANVSGVERQLALLCGWALQLDRAGSEFGLLLPDAEIRPGRGPHHLERCLKALASHNVSAPGK